MSQVNPCAILEKPRGDAARIKKGAGQPVARVTLEPEELEIKHTRVDETVRSETRFIDP
jgi:hypothetical protein